MDLERFIWELLDALIFELFETVVLQADVVLDCGATDAASGVEAAQILVDAVKKRFV